MAAQIDNARVLGEFLAPGDLPRSVTNVRSHDFKSEDRPNSPAIIIGNRRFDDCVFEGLQVPHLRLQNCRLDRVSFRLAKLVDLRLWGCEFKDCCFEDANIRSASFGGIWKQIPNSFIRTSFTRADLRSCNSGKSEFIECDFSNAKLTRFVFAASRISTCRFLGTIKEVGFGTDLVVDTDRPEPTRLLNIDFSKAQFQFCDFGWIECDNVTWPSTEICWVMNTKDFVDHRHWASIGDRLSSVGRERLAGFFEDTQKKKRGSIAVLDRATMGLMLKPEELQIVDDLFRLYCINI